MAKLFYLANVLSAFLFSGQDEPSTPLPVAPSFGVLRNQELIADKFDSLFRVLSTQRGFNGNILVSHNGSVLYEHAFGYSDLRRKTPLNIKSVFELASVSKQFTSAAIMMLHDQGKLDFSDPIQKYFPDLPYEHVTIRQLLAHRSGIPNYMYFSGKYWKKNKEYLTNADVLDMLVTHAPKPEFAPDQRYKYSNTGYAILAAVVEKISGLAFDDYMKQHIFAPLGMVNTFVFNPKRTETIEYQTIGHTKNRTPVHEGYLNGVVGDKGVYSTVEDMFKWDQALYSDRLIKQATLNEAYTPLSYDYVRDSEYGYGWRIETLADGTKIVYHAGLWGGYNSLYVRRLEDKTCIVVLSNKVNWSFRNIGNLLGLIDSSRFGATSMGGD
jgi:CubicO group peptidase (beta-lactamase class C family)